MIKSYTSVEAILEKDKVKFTDNSIISNNPQKILITYINENNDLLNEMPESEITSEIINLSEKALKMDKKLLHNI